MESTQMNRKPLKTNQKLPTEKHNNRHMTLSPQSVANIGRGLLTAAVKLSLTNAEGDVTLSLLYYLCAVPTSCRFDLEKRYFEIKQD